MQFFVVVAVFVFEAVFGVDLDGVLVLLGLDGDDVVALLLLLVDLLVRDVAVERLEGVGADVRQLRGACVSGGVLLRRGVLASWGAGLSREAGLAEE